MKKNIMLLLLFVVIIFSQQTIIAQVKTKIYANGIPKELRKTNFKINEVFVPEPSNFDALLKSKGETESSIEYKNKFAVPVIVDYDLMQLAQKAVDNNTINYNLKIIANKALNLSLSFSEFKLSKNSILSISTDFEVTDSITSKENNSRQIWASRVYQGNFIYLTLSIPESELHLTKIKIDQVNFGFTAVGGGFFGNPGQSATCNINVLCPQGNGWENERNSVALIVSGGGEICTGTLVMNTCGSNIPYLLTANHCLNSNVQNWVFQFQTWSNTCNPNGTFREDVQFNGCQLRANNAATDFALVELNQTPPANSGINYSGWDRTNTPATSGSSIHHPQGDLMKISLYNQQAISVPWFSGASNHWRVSFNQGIVQQGSSGSALYNQNRRLVGQLHGNQNNVCPNPGTNNCWCTTQIPSVGEYGRFDLSWSGGGTPATRLSDWLDPSNNGQQTTNTTNVANLTAPQPVFNANSLNISGPNLICNSSDYFITNLPAGAIVTWSIPANAGPVLQLAPNMPSQNQLRITNQKWYGVTTTLSATISNLPCNIPNQTRMLTIANDNSTSATVGHPYFQEACSFYNVPHPSQSGTIFSNSSPVFVHQGCMVYVNLGDMTGRTVTLGSGGTPLFWAVGSTIYYQNTLYFQLPLGSGGIPFTFNINGSGACFQRTLLFFSYTGNARYAFAATPNPTKDQLIVTAKEDEKFLAENKLSSTKEKLQFTMNVYDINTNTLRLTQRSSIGSLQHKLNVSNLTSGYYVLQILNGKEIQTIKFLKE